MTGFGEIKITAQYQGAEAGLEVIAQDLHNLQVEAQALGGASRDVGAQMENWSTKIGSSIEGLRMMSEDVLAMREQAPSLDSGPQDEGADSGEAGSQKNEELRLSLEQERLLRTEHQELLAGLRLSEEERLQEHYNKVQGLRRDDLGQAESITQARAQLTDKTSRLESQALGKQVSGYASAAKNLAGIVGAGRREQAFIEGGHAIVQAAMAAAKAIGPPPDPQAALAAVAWTAAAKEAFSYAKKGGGSVSSSGGRGSGSRGKADKQEPEAEAPSRSRIVVNVDSSAAVVDRYEFARHLVEAINENMADNVLLELGS